MKYNRKDIADRVVIARKKKNLKQPDIYNALHISQTTYSRYETAKCDISLPVLFELSEILDVSISWLITGIESVYKRLDNSEAIELEQYADYLISKRKRK